MLFSNISEFERSIFTAVINSTDLTIDIRNVDFMDTAGITALLSAYRKQTEQDKALTVLVKKGSQPDYVLGVTGMTLLLSITYDPSVALSVGGPSELLCREFPSSPSNISVVYQELREACNNLPCCEGNASAIMTAIWEAVTNGMVHGSPDGEQDAVKVRMSYDENGLHIEITSRKSEFQLPETKPEPQPDSDRGRGLYLIYEAMDEVWQTKIDEGSTLHMLKRCK